MDWHGTGSDRDPRERWKALRQRAPEGSWLLSSRSIRCARRIRMPRAAGPLAGVPLPSRTTSPSAVLPPHLRVAHARALRLPLHGHGRRTAPAGRGRRSGQDQPRRVRHGFLHRELGPHGNKQPLGPAARSRRLQRRLGRGGCRRHGGIRTGKRHRRIGTAACRLLRRVRPEADLGLGFALRPGCIRVVPRGHRRNGQDGRHDRAAFALMRGQDPRDHSSLPWQPPAVKTAPLRIGVPRECAQVPMHPDVQKDLPGRPGRC